MNYVKKAQFYSGFTNHIHTSGLSVHIVANHTFLSILSSVFCHYTVKPVLSGHSKRTEKNGFQYRLSLNAGQYF